MLVLLNDWLELRLVDSPLWTNNPEALLLFVILWDRLLNRTVMLLIT